MTSTLRVVYPLDLHRLKDTTSNNFIHSTKNLLGAFWVQEFGHGASLHDESE